VSERFQIDLKPFTQKYCNNYGYFLGIGIGIDIEPIFLQHAQPPSSAAKADPVVATNKVAIANIDPIAVLICLDMIDYFENILNLLLL
jgi:hypothetical protein